MKFHCKWYAAKKKMYLRTQKLYAYSWCKVAIKGWLLYHSLQQDDPSKQAYGVWWYQGAFK